MAIAGSTRVRGPVGSESRPQLGKQFIGDAVAALETVRALIGHLVENGVINKQQASTIEETASRKFLMRAMEAEAKATTPDPIDPREKQRVKGHL